MLLCIRVEAGRKATDGAERLLQRPVRPRGALRMYCPPQPPCSVACSVFAGREAGAGVQRVSTSCSAAWGRLS